MSNLLKIKNLTKSLVKEFGDTVEGQGYLMILAMLEKEEKSTPHTIIDMHKAICDKLREHNVPESFFSFEIRVYCTKSNRFQAFVVGKSVEKDNPIDFYKEVVKTIESDATAYILKEGKKISDIAL